jgi:hypothetical protein
VHQEEIEAAGGHLAKPQAASSGMTTFVRTRSYSWIAVASIRPSSRRKASHWVARLAIVVSL